MAPSSDSFLEIEYLVRLENVEVGMGLAITWGTALTVFQISKTGVVEVAIRNTSPWTRKKRFDDHKAVT